MDSLADDVVAGRDHALRVTLWRRDPSSGDCAVADAYDDPAQPVKLWVDRHAGDPGGSGPRVLQQTGGGDLPDTEPPGNNVELDFSAATLGGAGRAPLTLQTDDVGKYALEILDDTSGFAVDTAGNPRPIAGGSSDYVVRPFALRVTAARPDSTANPAAADADGGVFVAAGADFEVTVTGVQYDPADDPDGDGFPGDYSDNDPTDNVDLASGNAPTNSLGQEGTTETVSLRHALWRPTGPADPGLRGGEPLTLADFRGQVVVLTGDSHAAADRLRAHGAFDEVFAEVRPEAKSEIIRQLRTRGPIAMVGDGSNDAPALAEADLGIAFGPTALAADSADVVVTDSELRRVPQVFALARQTRRRIRQNLGWAFLYNVVAIPLAIASAINPLFAALAMASSSLLVVINSSRGMDAE